MTRKKIIPFILLTTLLLTVAIAVLFGVSGGDAAAEAAVSWKARVTKQTTVDGQTRYVDIASGSSVTDTTNFTFVISGYAESDNFEYYVSHDKIKNDKETLDALKAEWTRISDKREIDDTTGLTSVFTSGNKDEVYIYFRRSYTDNSKVATEYYSSSWHLTINCSLTESDLGIEEIKATYQKNGVSVEYGSEWIGVGLRFVITTKYMKEKNVAFDAGNELLSYSVDGKDVTDNTKRWLPMNYNYVTVTDTLYKGRVDFKVTDVGSKYAKYESYEGDNGVNIDTNSPIFSVSATTKDSAAGTVKNYQNREWASSDVTFGFTDASKCISGVKYQYSYDGVNFQDVEGSSYVVRTSAKGIRFRAKSTAGVIYDYNDGAEFTVNIDAVQPGATAEMFTDDPDNNGTLKEIYAAPGCSQLYGRQISGYNGTDVTVKYDDCNPFGVLVGDFTDSEHSSASVSESTTASFNKLSQLFADFMSEKTDKNYALFKDAAMSVYNNSLVSFTKNASGVGSALIGINHNYFKNASAEYRTAAARLFGIGDADKFIDYSERLISALSSEDKSAALLNGGFKTNNGSYIFPIAIKNDVTSPVLMYLIVENKRVSVWVNNIDSALKATNFNSSYNTGKAISNVLYCKNVLFVTVPRFYTAITDANGQVYLNIYNKDSDGNYINNTSGVKFYYAVSVDGGEYGDYKQATVSVTDGENVYYRLTDVLSTGVSSVRKYKFYVESGAGLRSSETVYAVKILNSFFEIEVDDITYTPNASGWSATPIPVYVTVPTDSKIERNSAGEILRYTAPTTKYTFYYSPLNIAGLTYEAQGEYYSYVENEEGKSVYVFYLSASAESTFSIYAKNGAGKRSDNTYTGVNVIKIDVIEPEVETSAYVFPESDVGGDYVYITSAEWVNGRIIFTFNVKDGVSGVYVKDLNFAVDGEGNPIYNGNGELIWQESANSRTASGTVNREDGSRYYVYNVEIGLPDSTVVTMSKEYRFRIYTGSGVYKDVSFVANIDTTRIQLDSIDFITDEETKNVAVISNKITLPSVREGATIKLIPNSEQAGHFGYYVYNEITGVYDLVDGEELEFTVPSDRKGELVKKFYLVSKAKDYKGVFYSTDSTTPYEIVIPYNTLNISINYELITDTVSGSAEWVDSNLTVQIGLTSDDTGTVRELTEAEKADYTYFYMLINNAPDLNLTEAIKTGTWLKCENGGYVAGSNVYSFEIDFSHSSFYGYIALSVTNEAGFRSSTAGDVNRLLFIDRTTPDVSDMISVTSGINERATIEGASTRTYYSKDEITLTPKTYTDRSVITYYYYLIGEDGTLPADNPSGDSDNGWTKLTRNISLYVTDGETASYEYLLYAVNELGRYAGGVSGARYVFEIDTSKISGTLSYNQNDGGYYDPTLGMQAYIWKDAASISLKTTGSNTYVKYYYSIDDGKTWEAYLEPNGSEVFYAPGENNAKTLTFNAAYFPDGINNAFSFKVVNKAGSEYVFQEKIYIAIDTMIPEFSVSLSVDGVSYDGGGTELSSYSTANWSNRPVTIKINPVKVNVSGVKYTYKINYLVNKTPTTTPERETPSNDTFTTDRLDGFGINRDAVVTIRATSRADSSKYSEVSFRVKVDQTVPVFTLTGQASNDDYTETKTITSGEWTNYPLVSVSKASDPDYVNVSNVYYTYTYKDLESTGITTHNWPDGNPVFDRICTITVTARSDAGLTYVREFAVNIDTVVPKIGFMKSESISVISGGKQYIDLKVYVEEENIEICEYITTKGETRGFAFDPAGYVISTSSVDNTVKYDKDGVEYRGYVYIYVKDYAGNTATFEFYMLPFELDVNNVTLKNEDKMTIDKYETDLNAAESYMEPARVTYFRNLIQRLRDRVQTLENEIATYRAYLEKLAQRTSFELKSDYAEMYEYLETYNNYKLYGQEWIQEEIIGDSSSSYYTYFQNLNTQFERLRKQMAAVEDIEDQVTKLPAINMVEATDYDDVLTVYKAYGDLTSDQKACFTTHLYTKLLALKKRCEVLLLTDEDSGISLDGGFAEQAKIKVESFAEGSEYYTNAQTAVLNAVKDENAARAVVAIYRISITGAASQTSTGTVTIEMPIPEDYRQYVRFAVYEMSADGALTQVKDMKINGDGKAVTFTSDALTTYVLTTKANIQVNDTKTDTYGKFLGLDLDVEMIRTLAIIGGVLFAVVIVVVIIAGIRHKRFLNTYNRAYKSGIYRRGIQRIPKGNTRPRTNPQYPTERVKTQKKPY